jgi:hypothetical protein
MFGFRICGAMFGFRICGGVSRQRRIGALFLNCQEGMIFKSTLKDMGHPQPKYQCIATTQPPSVLQITPSTGKDREQWK